MLGGHDERGKSLESVLPVESGLQSRPTHADLVKISPC